MSTLTIVLLVILVVLIAALIALYFFGKKAQKKQKFLDSPSLIIVRGGAVNGGVYVPFILTMFPNQFSSLIDLNYIQYIINKINFFISGCSI